MQRHVLIFALPTLLTACLEPSDFPARGQGDGAETESAMETDGDVDPPDEVDDDSDEETGAADGGETDGDSGEPEPEPEPEPDPVEPACRFATHRCVDPVPAGWNGPVRATDAAGCTGDWAVEAITTHDSVMSPGSACACSCGTPSGGLCADETEAQEFVEFFGQNLTGCETPTRAFDLDDSWANPYGGGGLGLDLRYIVEPPDVIAVGTCSPDPTSLTEYQPSVDLEGELTMCGTEDVGSGTCDGDGVCVPLGDDSFEAGVCIWADGDVECPGGEFSERRVVYTDVLDTRECGACSCGAAEGQACSDATVRVTTTPFDSQHELDADGTCEFVDLEYPDNEYVNTLHLEPGSPSGGACEGTREAYGDVESVDPVTVCCTAL